MDRYDELMKMIDSVYNAEDHDLLCENANTAGHSPVGQLAIIADNMSKTYGESLLDEDVLEKFKEGSLYIHDWGWGASGTTTCLQIPLDKLFEKGFYVGECFIRPPKTISTAFALTAIALQSNQNNQHGGQSIPSLDFYLAPFVKMSYERNFKNILETAQIMNAEVDADKARELAWDKTKEETYQAAEAFVHNCNSMMCRNGCQVPFVSVNFGLDTSPEGRLVSEMIMRAQMAGLGNGETAIFPKH